MSKETTYKSVRVVYPWATTMVGDSFIVEGPKASSMYFEVSRKSKKYGRKFKQEILGDRKSRITCTGLLK
jgi:hypothetical protein